MNNFIFNQKQQSINTVHENNNSEYFCLSGSQDFLDDNGNPRINLDNDSRVLAKKIIRDDGSIKYVIKTDASSKFQNPISIYGKEKTSNFLDRICRSSDKFREVNIKTFDMYITFLRTKNIAWLHNAEREAE